MKKKICKTVDSAEKPKNFPLFSSSELSPDFRSILTGCLEVSRVSDKSSGRTLAHRSEGKKFS